ncbi:hypothetical protein POM88_023517 [Heracleum sosnowskyi]|uniref:Trichome birefringence-like N-terminal domain-containing protein n=1 Tax=Heracleum sosnowskyi TaxID=360622 RepID=A0AAD8IK15_9APIA|nr:hypothetical protein POM88_023517 [Heracleum sosnowskyi]
MSYCDLYHGQWVYHQNGPLYYNNSCPVLMQKQNCQGRRDKEYENWRWKPERCNLPRFDPKKFLELMRRKTLAFIGHSVTRNQMESMLCILWQASIPTSRCTYKILKDEQALQHVTETAEKAKMELSSLTRQTLAMAYGPQTHKNHSYSLTRPTYEELCSYLSDRIKNFVENSLREAKLFIKDIDEVSNFVFLLFRVL